eukprot:TRINITY_DN93293_c0_g1_i1.p1 TRINITY_DN93293_c0_g1~~TRINITY_DN93293_c0_g1_i1.p1  ORF type:complete len:254 (-),score=53.20 TRINITY_DN93293_c0_g1_i1:119-817(-)
MAYTTHILLTAALLGAAAAAPVVKLVTFDGSSGTTFEFQEFEDPVMGSRSWGNWSVNTANGFGALEGIVTLVPRPAVSIVGASPGFIKAGANGHFPDASAVAGGSLLLEVRSLTPYSGFHVSFASGANSPHYACEGGGNIPFSRGCFKAKFEVPQGNDFSVVRVPLADMSDEWLPRTGEIRKTCSEDSTACVTAKKLSAIQRVELWAEGQDGQVHLEVRSISIEGPAATMVV